MDREVAVVVPVSCRGIDTPGPAPRADDADATHQLFVTANWDQLAWHGVIRPAM